MNSLLIIVLVAFAPPSADRGKIVVTRDVAIKVSQHTVGAACQFDILDSGRRVGQWIMVMKGAECGYIPVSTTLPLSAAEPFFNQQVATDRDEAALIARSNFWTQMGDNNKCLDDLDAAIAKQPSNAQALLLRGLAKSRAGDFEGAADDYSAAIVLDPSDAYLRYNRGTSRMRLGDMNGAVDDLSAAIELDRNFTKAYSNRGAAYFALNAFDEAIPDLTQALRLDPGRASAHFNRGMAFLRDGKIAEARTDFEDAMRLRHDDVQLLNEVARIYAADSELRIRDGATALRLAHHVCDLTKHRVPEYLDTLTAAYVESRDFQRAEEINQETRKLRRGQPSEFSSDLSNAIEARTRFYSNARGGESLN